MTHGQKKVIITISVVALIVFVSGWFFVYQNNLPRQLARVSGTQNSPDTQNAGEELSTTTGVYGQLVDKDGDPVLDEVRMYFVDARTAPEGEITSIEGERIHVAAAYSDELRMSYSTDKNGGFDFTVPNGEYYFAFSSYWEPLDPPMKGHIWLSNESDKPTIGKVSLTGKPQKFNIRIHNNGYESKKESIVIHAVQPGDTLWSLAEKYYGSGDQWALIARLNDIELLPNKSILIEAGQTIKIPRKGWYETDEVAQNLRTLVHGGEFRKTITYTNEEYGYQLKYPGFWILENITKEGVLHSKRLVGPTIHLRMHSFKPQPADVEIAVYDNTAGMSLEEFLIDKYYADRIPIERGYLATKSFAGGGTLIDAGTTCRLYCANHLVFFKNNKVYILSFPTLKSLKEDEEVVYNELQSILTGFTLLEIK